MKLLLDEQLSPQIARVLRERGLDAEAVGERDDLREAPDRDVMETAARERRAVVTNNVKDLRPIAAERLSVGRGHAGLVLLPATRSRRHDATVALADAIEAVARANPRGLAESERWVATAGS